MLRTAGDAACGGECGFGGVNEGGVHAVHQAAQYVSDRGPQDSQDGDGDEQTDEWVGQWEAECCASGAEKHSQGGESVGAGVQTVGDHSDRADTGPTRMR